MTNNTKKTALVVGGSRGIGRAIALRLAASGFDIWLTYKGNHEAAQKVKSEIDALGRTCDLIPFDVSSYEETEAALGSRLETVSPDVFVYNSGISRDNLLMWMTKDEWKSVLSTNLDGFFNVGRAVVFAMLKAKRGRIVIVSSASGQIGQAGQVNYSASKAGLIGAAKALAREVGKTEHRRERGRPRLYRNRNDREDSQGAGPAPDTDEPCGQRRRCGVSRQLPVYGRAYVHPRSGDRHQWRAGNVAIAPDRDGDMLIVQE